MFEISFIAKFQYQYIAKKNLMHKKITHKKRPDSRNFIIKTIIAVCALFLQLFLIIQLDNCLVQHISGLAKHILKLQDLKQVRKD